MSHDFIASLFNLISLDQLKQSHMELSLSLTSAILLAFLSGLVEGHCDFTRVQSPQHTLKSLEQFTDQMAVIMRDVHNLLEEIVSIHESTYTPRPSMFGEVLKSSQAKHMYPNFMHSLTPTLKITLNLLSVLWKDLKLGRNLARSIRRSNPVQVMEARSFKSHSSRACTTLKALHYYVHNMLVSSWHQPSPLSPLRDGKPITYSKTRNNIKILLDRLFQYDMRAVMEIVDGCIRESDSADTEGCISDSMGPDRLSDILNSSIIGRLDLGSHVCVKSDSARLMTGLLGDLMAAYFTDKKLLVLLSSDTSLPARHAELSKNKLTTALRNQDLMDSWTVERTVNMLLLSGKWERACNFVVELGDWRKAFVLAAIFSMHSKEVSLRKSFSVKDAATGGRLTKLSHELALSNVLKLIGMVYRKPAKPLSYKQMIACDDDGTKPSGRLCEQFVSETFRVCALAQVDTIARTCAGHFLKELVSVCASLSTQVHSGLYLPAPPLYCSQPAITEEV